MCLLPQNKLGAKWLYLLASVLPLVRHQAWLWPFGMEPPKNQSKILLTYSNSARGKCSSQNGAIVNDGGVWCASAASRASVRYAYNAPLRRTLDDVREAVTMLEEADRTARRVLGGAHLTKKGIEAALRKSRAVLRAREPVPPENLCFHPAVGFTGPPVNFPREGEEQAETPR